MPFNPSFTAIQLYATPTILRVIDNSFKLDSTFSATFDSTFASFSGDFYYTRKVYLRIFDGSYLIPKGNPQTTFSAIFDNTFGNPIFIKWNKGDYIDIDVLDKDYAIECKVECTLFFYPIIFDNSFSKFFN